MQPTRLFDYIYYQQANHPLEECLVSKVDGVWKAYSTAEVIDYAKQTAAGMLELGLQPGDKIAIVSYENRPEWMIIDLAALQIGVISVPLYATISPREYEYILNDAGVEYAFVGAEDLYDKVKEAQQNVSSLKEVFTMDQVSGRPFWKDIWNTSRIDEIAPISDRIQPEDLATIIYTSGTTGNPKGVMLNHINIGHSIQVGKKLLPAQTGDKVLSFLPLCHIYERAVSLSYVYKGVRIYFTGTKNLGGPDGDLQNVKPAFFTTVPRLLEKVYEAIYNKGLELTGVKRSLFFWALDLTEDYEYNKTYGGLAGMKRKVADRLIYSKWRDALGGNVKGIATAAAPCPQKIIRVFSAAGIPIREAYGLTETAPSISGNEYLTNKALIGTVGPINDNITVEIDSSDGSYLEGEGEIIVTGSNVMMGYYNKPEKTAEVILEKDGKRWLKTGDIGKFVTKHGVDYLKITDRKKELLKTSGGKYVAPAPIESKLKESFLVEQAMVIGDKQKFVSVLIVPAEEALKDWCENNNVAWSGMHAAVTNSKVLQAYQDIIDAVNPNFSHIEQVKKFALLNAIWDATRDDGTDAELTPTMKLKRRVIRKKYADAIETIYA